MAKKRETADPVLGELAAIRSLIQDLVILQAAEAGVDRAQVRKIVGVGDARITRIWKYLKLKPTKNKT